MQKKIRRLFKKKDWNEVSGALELAVSETLAIRQEHARYAIKSYKQASQDLLET